MPLPRRIPAVGCSPENLPGATRIVDVPSSPSRLKTDAPADNVIRLNARL